MDAAKRRSDDGEDSKSGKQTKVHVSGRSRPPFVTTLTENDGRCG
jgi:hypothetical protein